ncbi:MAG TPA: 4Fe-4S dicluster domain-containing protein [Candidatus Baltobacteraceae bacterium]|jgi:formate dehydrogenase iron-sulfur subunit
MPNGFFTDTTLCIGCKACEVACKQWNELPSDGFEFSGNSYDNTLQLSGTTWRHVSFVEQMEVDREGSLTDRWLMMSDVCKHCTHAGCMDACPTGAIVRNEFGNVYIQPDVCNGCGYCVVSCPFGVVDLIGKGAGHDDYNVANLNGDRKDRQETALQATGGVAGKCTLCYDRQRDGFEPACAKACPTESIQFGDVAELQERAKKRVETLQERGVDSYLYGVDSKDSVGDLNAFFLLTERPEAYNLPPKPVLPATHQPAGYASAALAAVALTVAGAAIFARAR